MVKVFGKSLAEFLHHEGFSAAGLDEGRIFLILQYQSGYTPDCKSAFTSSQDDQHFVIFGQPSDRAFCTAASKGLILAGNSLSVRR